MGENPVDETNFGGKTDSYSSFAPQAWESSEGAHSPLTKKWARRDVVKSALFVFQRNQMVFAGSKVVEFGTIARLEAIGRQTLNGQRAVFAPTK